MTLMMVFAGGSQQRTEHLQKHVRANAYMLNDPPRVMRDVKATRLKEMLGCDRDVGRG